ncbi:two-component system copper resistance phosphate regulon response regulator CusR [Nocardia pseudobrasiliensis]|uniref:Two-component system copper resistance phosphate regulon response regulator CusR n=2 Tax=Nocardia pseudobrasiliensis TaxID=45979 RepID=A0A370I7R5_9NOCA|nr:two-component system copper resistance phosphate regulon response regulator CusR [Nocardia pseudobrasiliensis]
MRVLVVEDDRELGDEVADGLRAAGFAVDLARDMADADLKITVNAYDCLIIDRGLPDGDGLDLVRAHRESGDRTPVLILTARDGLADRLDGFAHGADDYVVKPFDLDELAARVRALCRRQERPAPTRTQIRDLVVDRPRRRVQRAGVLLTLTPKEFGVLELLATRAGSVVTRTELIECCWDEMAEPASNVVDVVIAQLRRKLGAPPLIDTVRGVGFTIEP